MAIVDSKQGEYPQSAVDTFGAAIQAAENIVSWTASTQNSISNDINAIAVTGIILNKTTISIKKGNTLQLMGTIMPEDASNKAVIWKAEDENIDSVNENGLVKGVRLAKQKVQLQRLMEALPRRVK